VKKVLLAHLQSRCAIFIFYAKIEYHFYIGLNLLMFCFDYISEIDFKIIFKEVIM